MKVKALLHVVVGELYSEVLGLRYSALSNLLLVGCVLWNVAFGLLYANFSVAILGWMPFSI